jgi:O-antigen/teichoic acid export membrane protein
MKFQGSNKVVFNTGVLYTKMIISVFISLLSTRLILSELGEADYGIYVLIGGVVAMLSFLNISMATSTQRFLSFSLGKNNIEEVRKVFANSIILHFILGVLLLLLFEFIGMFFLIDQLKIFPERISTAKILFHFIVASTFISIISVPYDGILNAKENMFFLSIVGVFDSLLKLGIALTLLHPFDDKLLLFGVLMMVKSFIIRIIKQIYCQRKYKEETVIKVKNYYDFPIFKELYSFAGWNLIGILGYLFKTQGITVVLNLFFNTVIIAAYGIANQVNSQLRLFTESMIQSLQPQIVKSEGSGDRERMIKLSLIASKFSFYLFSFLALPLYINLEYILNLWLVKVPEGTFYFLKLIIILSVIQQFRTGILIATHSIGKIKEYQLFNAPVQLLSLPLGYLFLYLGYPFYSIILATIFIEIIIVFLNIFFFKKLTAYPPLDYVKNILLNGTLILLITYFTGYYVGTSLPLELPFLKLIITTVLCTLLFSYLIYCWSLNEFEKNKIKEIFTGVLSKLKSL